MLFTACVCTLTRAVNCRSSGGLGQRGADSVDLRSDQSPVSDNNTGRIPNGNQARLDVAREIHLAA
jgi:hypothetical protein